MPSKALLRPGELLRRGRAGPRASPSWSAASSTPRPVLARRDEVIHDLDDSGSCRGSRRGIELIRGRAALDGERTVIVGPDRLTARQGGDRSRPAPPPAIPPIDGLAEARPWTNREATTASEVPGRLLILGGGVVGVEMAQAWASLGASVTLVEALDRVLANEEPFASERGHRGARGRRGRGAHRRQGDRRLARRGRTGLAAARGRRGAARRRAAGRGRAAPADRRARARAVGVEARRLPRRRRLSCGSAARTGCTRSATSTGARCSPTWASTRRGSAPMRSSARR